MNIKILGSGCSNCRKLYEETLSAVKNLNRDDIQVEYITNISVALSYGIMSTPALLINDKAVSQGRVLRASEIETLILKN